MQIECEARDWSTTLPVAVPHSRQGKRGRLRASRRTWPICTSAVSNYQYLHVVTRRVRSRMKLIQFLFSICLVCGFTISPVTRAQDEPRAAWQVTNFDITVPNPGGERALNARATLSLRNIGRGAGSTLSLRINSKAEIKSVTIGSTTATYQSRPETRGNSQRVTISLPASVPSNENITATVEYRVPVIENNG